MDFSSDPKPSPRREVQLQGPRPAPLKVSKDSHKIRKPPVAPAQQHHPPPQQQQAPRAPVIIYTVSPKVIHTEPGDFMTLVQRLTGPSPTGAAAPMGSLSPGPVGPISPAARFAAIELGCPQLDPHKPPPQASFEDMDDQLDFSTVLDMSNLPGILSPFPSSLPAISPNYFTPPPSASDLESLAFLNEMSPVFRGGNRGFVDGPFLSSPSSNLLFTPTLPSPGALWDILGQL